MSSWRDLQFDVPLPSGGPNSPLTKFPAPKPKNFDAMWQAYGKPEYQAGLKRYQDDLDEHGYQGPRVDEPYRGR